MSLDPQTVANLQNLIQHMPDQYQMDLGNLIQAVMAQAYQGYAANTAHIGMLQTRVKALEAAANITPDPSTVF